METEKVTQFHLAMYSRFEDMQANESLRLYAGSLSLYDGSQTFNGTGNVEFTFVPELAVHYELGLANTPAFISSDNENQKIEVPGLTTSVAIHLTSFQFGISSSPSPSSISGSMKEAAQYGVQERLGRVKFSLVNFHDYYGQVIYRAVGGKPNKWRGRATFEFDKWVVTLDALHNILERRKQAKASNGYAVTHVGMLRRRDDKLFGADEAYKILDFLYWFFAFANGGRCGCILPEGLRHTGSVLWENWQAPKLSRMKYHQSWFAEHAPSRCFEAAQGCFSLWQDENKRDWLRRAIAIYVESNRNLSGVDLALANSQMALELLAWTVLIEEKGVITEESFQKLTAADKFRLMLAINGIPASIPASATDLLKSFKPGKGVDGPHVIAEIRNAVIHPTRTKHAWLKRLSSLAQYQAWQLSQYYIELVLLKLFDYSGPYENRFGNPPMSIFEIVPWAK